MWALLVYVKLMTLYFKGLIRVPQPTLLNVKMHEEEFNANSSPPFFFLLLQSYQYMWGRCLIQTVNKYISGLPLIGMTRGRF